jgi:hypothetical protein
MSLLPFAGGQGQSIQQIEQKIAKPHTDANYHIMAGRRVHHVCVVQSRSKIWHSAQTTVPLVANLGISGLIIQRNHHRLQVVNPTKQGILTASLGPYLVATMTLLQSPKKQVARGDRRAVQMGLMTILVTSLVIGKVAIW